MGHIKPPPNTAIGPGLYYYCSHSLILQGTGVEFLDPEEKKATRTARALYCACCRAVPWH